MLVDLTNLVHHVTERFLIHHVVDNDAAMSIQLLVNVRKRWRPSIPHLQLDGACHRR